MGSPSDSRWCGSVLIRSPDALACGEADGDEADSLWRVLLVFLTRAMLCCRDSRRSRLAIGDHSTDVAGVGCTRI